jgi:hypothetical protein
LKSVAVRRLWREDFLPEEEANRRHRVGEGRLLFGVPEGMANTGMMGLDVLCIDQTDHTEQAQQTGRRTKHRPGDVLSGCLEAQMSTHLLEGRLNGPAGVEPTDDLLGRQRGVGAVEVLIPRRALEVSNEDPANRDYAGAGLVPQARAAVEVSACGLKDVESIRSRWQNVANRFTGNYTGAGSRER